MTLLAPPPSLVVADIIGPTVQGEGPSAGRRCSVIRLGGCNLACSWCDSASVWDGARYDLSAELTQRLVKNIVAEAMECSPSLVVISGGEPLLQQRHEGWAALLDQLSAVEVEVETNGTLPPSAETLSGATSFVVSPKLAHAGDPAWSRLVPEALQQWGALAREGIAAWAFVVRDATDLATVVSLAQLYEVPAAQVYVMPEGTTADGQLASIRRLVEPALASGLNLAPRLDVLLANPGRNSTLPIAAATTW